VRAAPISLLLDGWEHMGGCKASAAWGNHGTQQSSDGSMKQEEAAKLHRIKQVCAQGNEVFVQSRAEKKNPKMQPVTPPTFSLTYQLNHSSSSLT